jgi:hypothetical protein
VGSSFQYSLTSTWMGGVGRDAAFIVNHIRSNRNSSELKLEKSFARNR